MDQISQTTNENGFRALWGSWKTSMKGRIGAFLLILLLLALPIGLVNAYSNNQLYQNLLDKYKTVDIEAFNSKTDQEKQDFISSFGGSINDGLGDSVSAKILTFIVQLLESAVLVLAVLYYYDRHKKTEHFNKNLSKTSIWAIKKAPWVFLIQLFSSILLSSVLNFILVIFLSVGILISALSAGTTLLIIALVLGFFIIAWFIQTYILMYTSNMTITVALNRMRLMLSMFYTKILLHNKKKFAFRLVGAGVLLEFILPLVFVAPALYFNYINSSLSILLWGGAALLTILLKGFLISFYTANFLRMEKESATDITRLYNGGMMPKNQDTTSNGSGDDTGGED